VEEWQEEGQEEWRGLEIRVGGVAGHVRERKHRHEKVSGNRSGLRNHGHAQRAGGVAGGLPIRTDGGQ